MDKGNWEHISSMQYATINAKYKDRLVQPKDIYIYNKVNKHSNKYPHGLSTGMMEMPDKP